MVYSQNIDSLFSSGNDSYNKNKFDASVDAYENILSQGFYSADLYYNLGNAYYRLEDFANARWSYEMGINIDPRNKDMIHNLMLTKKKIPNTIEPPDSQILDLINNFLTNFTYSDFVLFSSIMLLLYSICFIIYRLMPSKPIVISYYVFIVLFFIGTSFSAIKFLWERNNNFGIILNDETKLYSAPFLNENITISIFFSGNKVKIEQTTDKWIEISSIDGRKGWIRLEDIRTLD
ncbi:MAG: SH3 domain-containing protein [Candidatus Neomarinimicrobiota bacterium]|nr:SH3 domain-containing protein [Candidatus Neomarinimicrobiota bacterium]